MARNSDSVETRETVLNTAERLFAERGIDGVSIRDITTKAKVNLAAINYHFGSKQELVKAVFKRRLVPLEQRRGELLKAAERKASTEGRGLKLEEVLTALILPMVEQGFGGRGDKVFFRLIGRCFSETNRDVDSLLRDFIERARKSFDPALLKADKSLKKSELFWKINFLMGAVHHSLLVCGGPNWLPSQYEEPIGADAYLHRLISFVAAGFRESF